MYNLIYIMMGDQCNYHCKYCLQRDNLELAIDNQIMDEKVYDFLIEQAKQCITDNNTLKVIFWGGEPLIYWETIKPIVERLAPLGIMDFGLISNGSLLTQDKVDFMNKYNIPFTLSHDGENTEYTRGRDILKESWFLDLYRQINYTSVISVISAQNQDMRRTRKYLRDNYGIENVHFDKLIESCHMPPEIYNFEMISLSRAMDAHVAKLVEAWETNIPNWESNYCNPSIVWMKQILDDPNGKMAQFPPCQNMLTAINIGLDGTVYLCHNSSIKLGTIDDDYDSLLKEFKQHNIRVRSEKCRSCEVFSLCGGGCLLTPFDERGERACIYSKLYYGKLLEAILKFHRRCNNELDRSGNNSQ